MWQFIWEITWLFPRKVWCFIVGHDECFGGYWEDDYCDRCYVDWPQDKITVPVLLNRAYCWAVEHGWPEEIDLWLMKHIKLPNWWEY